MLEFKKLIRKQHSLSKEMNDYLIKFVESKGGIINTSDNESRDVIMCFIYDEATDITVERKVLAVRTVSGVLLIKVALPNQDEEWYSIYQGGLVINATLYNLCDAIAQYV